MTSSLPNCDLLSGLTVAQELWQTVVAVNDSDKYKPFALMSVLFKLWKDITVAMRTILAVTTA